ncbi:MAG: glycosyltransferase, partial [Bacteroidales bacterium]|nr:glycosyltransferase [Bacteroidales bacterium]
ILRRAIDSVLNQTYPYFELIIVDDGSEPSLEPIVKEYTDDRIIFIIHPVNKGASAAHNTGIKAAKYDWIAFICHDDEWLPNKLEICVPYIENNYPQYMFFFHHIEVIDDKQNIVAFKTANPKTGNYYKIFLRDYNKDIQTSAIIINKECFDNCGYYDDDFKNVFDWELYTRIAEKYDFYFIPDKLSKYYYSVIGITHMDNLESINNITEMMLFVKKYKNKMSRETKLAWCFKLNSFVSYYKKQREYSLMLKFLSTSIKLLPFNFINLKDILKNILLKTEKQ